MIERKKPETWRYNMSKINRDIHPIYREIGCCGRVSAVKRSR
ncbi:hypothetical protein C8P63_110113 [Melghirimyces profundicolus]|uniref:Uncharacterized protein n=1 Tax=Melghirimyces profundicolus TaxID=1242148 RepID=A0A2T6BV63_9BACL|nr:hypothetical protein C8P63_110113 [Melghirimyces profundicolus]